MGFAFVYIRDKELFHLCLGNEKDGTERIKYVNDPNWFKPEPKPSPATLQVTIQNDLDWAAEDDFVPLHEDVWEDKLETLDKTKDEICPKIKVKLDPLICFHPEDENDFTVQQAFVKPLEDKHVVEHVLKAKNVPFEITKEDILQVFEFYATESRANIGPSSFQTQPKYTYPKIVFDKRTCFVTFSKSTNDAHFALCMTKKLFLDKGDKVHLLRFEYATKKDMAMLENGGQNNYNRSFGYNRYNTNSSRGSRGRGGSYGRGRGGTTNTYRPSNQK